MDNIVESLFGLSPYQVQQQQRQQLEQSAQRYGQADPFQRATQGMFQAGGMLGGMGAEAMGMVNPQVEQAKMRQAVMSQGGDLSTSAGLKAKAAQFMQAGDQQTAMKLVMAAREMEAKEQAGRLGAARERELDARSQRELAVAEAANTPKPPTPTEYARTLIEAGIPSGSPEFVAKMREYAMAKIKGTESGSGVKVVMPEQEKSFEKGLGEGQAKDLLEGRKLADDAVQMLETNKVGRTILDKGMVTGFGANAIVGIGQALKQAGINFGGDATANAQTYTSVMAQNVGKLIKQFGAGTGLSDADREYATKMAGGAITVDEAAIRKVIDINDKAAKNVIALHNKRASGVKTNVPLTVEIPNQQSSLQDAAMAELARRKGK